MKKTLTFSEFKRCYKNIKGKFTDSEMTIAYNYYTGLSNNFERVIVLDAITKVALLRPVFEFRQTRVKKR